VSGRLFWLASYPKSGNTWFRAFLRNLESGAKQPAQAARQQVADR
tara:strand:+ start:897 stop:1031 length:135 start_codon:yes stop_codon:yes gene_type:complete